MCSRCHQAIAVLQSMENAGSITCEFISVYKQRLPQTCEKNHSQPKKHCHLFKEEFV